jgi:hypothetical protein
VERSRKWILNAQKQNRKLLRDRCDLFLDAKSSFDAKLLPEKSEKKGTEKQPAYESGSGKQMGDTNVLNWGV